MGRRNLQFSNLAVPIVRSRRWSFLLARVWNVARLLLGYEVAYDLVDAFIIAEFTEVERHVRRSAQGGRA